MVKSKTASKKTASKKTASKKTASKKETSKTTASKKETSKTTCASHYKLNKTHLMRIMKKHTTNEKKKKIVLKNFDEDLKILDEHDMLKEGFKINCENINNLKSILNCNFFIKKKKDSE